MKSERIDKYARLLVKTGLNVQKGQALYITCPVDCADFARRCASAAYDLGCREVIMNWTDDLLMREKYLRAADSVFDTYPQWKADLYNGAASDGAAWLSIYSEDPECLSGVDQTRIQRATAVSGNAIRPFRDKQTTDFFPWCIASVPNPKWAEKVFPDLKTDEAVELLWEKILQSVRVGESNDPEAEWQAHNAKLKERREKLTAFAFKYLKYRSGLGTDLTIGLPEHHFWDGGRSTSAAGVQFNANMPTEEIFTAPMRTEVNGVVFASKPLVINGSIADNFSFTLEHGKIVGVKAERGQELLEKAIAVDEGASYLGEVALVPWDSPISNTKTLFYNTLFDENAACHLAFGDSYPCIEGGSKMSVEERLARGLNDSIMHEDFMIGTPDLEVVGVTADGKEISIMTNGNFAF